MFTINSVALPTQAAALRRRRSMQRQVLYTKPVTAEAGKPVQASFSPGRASITCLTSREHAQRLPWWPCCTYQGQLA